MFPKHPPQLAPRDKLLEHPLWASNSSQEHLSKKKGHWCDDPSYRKSTLKLIREIPFAGAFADTRGQTKFEGSGMVAWKVQRGELILFLCCMITWCMFGSA